MAWDWIKVEKATARKPEVLGIADALSIHPDHAFGLCIRFWFWCDDQMETGHAPGVTNVTLDSVFGHDGFTSALLSVGWLRVRNGSLEVPNFDRHLSESAKKRALSRIRKQNQRESEASRSMRDKSVTRDERIENRKKKKEKLAPKESPPRFIKPTLAAVTDYCRERENQVDPQRFLDHYESNGWKVGKNPMKDWKAAVRTWERNGFQNGKQIEPEDRVATEADVEGWDFNR